MIWWINNLLYEYNNFFFTTSIKTFRSLRNKSIKLNEWIVDLKIKNRYFEGHRYAIIEIMMLRSKYLYTQKIDQMIIETKEEKKWVNKKQVKVHRSYGWCVHAYICSREYLPVLSINQSIKTWLESSDWFRRRASVLFSFDMFIYWLLLQ
jgi:hypothetical protein